jgi:putative Ca2+/H+ antiporter (TMEM165/GDT1 family)
MGSVLVAFGLVFVAELGDKTQLAAMAFAARHRLAPVLGGLVVAYALANLLSVTIGGVVGAALPTRAIGVGGGLLFLAFAVWSWTRGDEDDDVRSHTSRSVFVTVAVTMFVAELGDKTMIAVATLAAQGDPVLTWIGATIGIVSSGALGVVVGRTLGARLPEHAVRTGSAVLFAAVGIFLVVANI